MTWAQDYAAENRRAMMDAVLRVMREELRPFQMGEVAVNCHHNYCTRERHFDADLIVTRKGAVSAKKASSESSRVPWVRVRSSCAAWGTPRASRAAATARVA
jgi:RNA-splicing ligase RtcB